MDVLDALINAARVFLETGFNAEDYLIWQQLAFLTILGLFGPLHYYTKNFGSFTEGATKRSLLTGEGLLGAAKEELARGQVPPMPDGKIEPSNGTVPYVPWLARRKKWYSLDSMRKTVLGSNMDAL